MSELDRTDRAILALLQEDARRSFKQVADSVGLAPSTVYDRVRRLRDHGVLRGVHADVDPAALGVRLQAMIFVQLAIHSEQSFTAFESSLDEPWVLDVFHLAGNQDFAVHVAARDAAHLRQLVMDITTRAEVAHLETSLVFGHRQRRVLPDYTDPAP
jgi:DNA-binding Lrp family transcriptional regulator